MKLLIGILFSAALFAQVPAPVGAGAGVGLATTDPTGAACTAASPVLAFNSQIYSCQSLVYALSNENSHAISASVKCTSGSGNPAAYTCSTIPSFTPAANDFVLFEPDAANTGSATLNVNGTGAITIRKNGLNLIPGDLQVNQVYLLVYEVNSGVWVLPNTARNLLNVRLLGAKGDGGTDDTTALQNAVNACAAIGVNNTGCTLYFPAGSYQISSPLLLPRTGSTPSGVVRVVGEGLRVSAIQGTGTFPTGHSLIEWSPQFVGATQVTTLNGSLSSGATSVTVTSGASIVNTHLLNIDNELLRVTAGGGTASLTVTRAVNGSIAAAHANSAPVFDYAVNGGNGQTWHQEISEIELDPAPIANTGAIHYALVNPVQSGILSVTATNNACPAGPSAVTFAGYQSTGSGATATYTTSGGLIAVTMTAAGSGYEQPVTATFAGCTPSAIVVNGPANAPGTSYPLVSNEWMQIRMRNVLFGGSNRYNPFEVYLEGAARSSDFDGLYCDPSQGSPITYDTICLETDYNDYNDPRDDLTGIEYSSIKNVNGGLRRGGYVRPFYGRLINSKWSNSVSVGTTGASAVSSYFFKNSYHNEINGIVNEGSGDQPQVALWNSSNNYFMNIGLGTPVNQGNGVGNGLELHSSNDNVFQNHGTVAQSNHQFSLQSVKLLTLDGTSTGNKFYNWEIAGPLSTEVTWTNPTSNYIESYNSLNSYAVEHLGNTISLDTTSGNRVAVESDFTTANNTNLQNITGLSWVLPVPPALNIPFQCHLLYSQASAAVAVSFGISASVTPTSIMATGRIETNTTVSTWGNLPTLTTTTPTAIVTGTPSAITTVWEAELSGWIENPTTAASTINVMVKTATGADAVTVKRGSFCVIQ